MEIDRTPRWTGRMTVWTLVIIRWGFQSSVKYPLVVHLDLDLWPLLPFLSLLSPLYLSKLRYLKSISNLPLVSTEISIFEGWLQDCFRLNPPLHPYRATQTPPPAPSVFSLALSRSLPKLQNSTDAKTASDAKFPKLPGRKPSDELPAASCWTSARKLSFYAEPTQPGKPWNCLML